MIEIKITKALQQKLDQLEALVGGEKERKTRAKELQAEIEKMIPAQQGLPHQGDTVWCWYAGMRYYTPSLYHGTVECVRWRPELQCFKLGVRCAGGALVWRTIDRVWKTEKEAKRWSLMRELKAAQAKLKAAQDRLDALNKQLEDD